MKTITATPHYFPRTRTAQKEVVYFKQSWIAWVAYAFIRVTIGTLVRTLFIKEISGFHHIPKKGAVIVAANHSSYLDFICFMAVAPRHTHYLAAEKFFSHPFWHIIMWATSQVRVDRKSSDKSHVHGAVSDLVKKGKIIGIFPEGTRSATGELGHAYHGAARYAISHKIPVIPMGIHGTHEIWPRHAKRPKIKKVIKLHIGESVHLADYYDKPLETPHYEQATRRIMEHIARLAGKEYKQEE